MKLTSATWALLTVLSMASSATHAADSRDLLSGVWAGEGMQFDPSKPDGYREIIQLQIGVSIIGDHVEIRNHQPDLSYLAEAARYRLQDGKLYNRAGSAVGTIAADQLHLIQVADPINGNKGFEVTLTRDEHGCLNLQGIHSREGDNPYRSAVFAVLTSGVPGDIFTAPGSGEWYGISRGVGAEDQECKISIVSLNGNLTINDYDQCLKLEYDTEQVVYKMKDGELLDEQGVVKGHLSPGEIHLFGTYTEQDYAQSWDARLQLDPHGFLKIKGTVETSGSGEVPESSRYSGTLFPL